MQNIIEVQSWGVRDDIKQAVEMFICHFSGQYACEYGSATTHRGELQNIFALIRGGGEKCWPSKDKILPA